MKFLPVILCMSFLIVTSVSNKTKDSSIFPVLNGTFFSNIKNSSISTSFNISSPYWLSPSGNVAFGFYKLPCSRSSQYCQDRYVVGIWLVKSLFKTLVWTTNGDDLREPSSIHFTNDGNLVLMVMPGNKEKRLIPYIKEPVSFGVLQDDGNLVFYGLGAQIVWQSIDHPSDTILGGQNLRSGVDLNSVGKRLHSSITSLNATTSHFSVFEGNPAWSKTNLTYGMSPNYMIDYINRNDILMALHSSFSRWSSVVELNFTEIQAYESADIKIGFYHGDHGDGLPFTQGILAHAFEPEIGMLHFNADVVWSVDFKSERRKDAFDLESVATHEIGHLLGLNHSSDQDAVMFWSIPRRTEKRELSADDVLGVQSLYRPNANYSPNYKDASGDNSVSLVNVLVSLIITGIFM